MSIRFRKRFKLAPGLHLNLSGSGLSLSAGPRGASMTFGARGTYFNAGLPGTGIYSRQKVGGSNAASSTIEVSITVKDDGTVEFQDANGNPLDERLIRKTKEQSKDAILNLLQGACDKFNSHIDAIEQVHLGTPWPDFHPTYTVRPFAEVSPPAPVLKRHGILGLLFKSVRSRIDTENAAASAAHERAVNEWEGRKKRHDAIEAEHKTLIEQRVLTDLEAMETVLEESLKDISWPRDTTVSAEVRESGDLILLDIDLPEIEELPKQTAAVPARGYKLSIKELPVTRLQQLYMRHIHAIAFRIIGEVFSVLPKSKIVVISGYSQRPDKSSGVITEQYLYSVRVPRDQWTRINFSNLGSLDVIEALARFDMRRDLSKTGVFKEIVPFDG